MRPGDVWMLYAPPDLAYGEKGVGPIPPNSALVFKIELISVLPRDASVGNG
jgi:peptidylprolyl isomerase/FKBP-type peptidyl-prolyl cis-trans isomerase FklB